MQCNATFKVLRARMNLGSCFLQDKENPELAQVLQVLRMEREARTEEPSPGFGDSRDAGLVLTVCGEDSSPLPNLGPLGLT